MPSERDPRGTVRKLVTLSADTARRVSDYRFGERINTESEALRRLVEAGLREAERKTATIIKRGDAS